MSDQRPVCRFVGCLREARELLHDPAVRQLLEALLLNADDPFVSSLLLKAPGLLSAPELGLAEVAAADDDDPPDDGHSTPRSSTRSNGSTRSTRSTLSMPSMEIDAIMGVPPPPPAYHSPTWDPVFVVECKTLGALLRDGPLHTDRLFRIAYAYRTASRHIPDRLDAFMDWLAARPRIFFLSSNCIVRAAEGADDFLSCKRDVMGYLAGCSGYKSTASAIQEAIPALAEEVRFVLGETGSWRRRADPGWRRAGVDVLHGRAGGGGGGDVRDRPGAAPLLLQPRVAVRHAPPDVPAVQVLPAMPAGLRVPALPRALAQELQKMVTAHDFVYTCRWSTALSTLWFLYMSAACLAAFMLSL